MLRACRCGPSYPLGGTAPAPDGDKLKVLHWDTSGLVLVWKQLEGSAFRWPPITDGTVRLSAVQFAALFSESGASAPFTVLLDAQSPFAGAQCQGMSSSMRLCGQPLTRRVSRSAR